MRNILISLGVLSVLAASPVLADDPASHTIGNDDLSFSLATDAVTGDHASRIVTFAYEPRGSQVVVEDRAWAKTDTIGGDDEPFSRD